MVSPFRIGVLLTCQFIQSFLFYDLIHQSDSYHIKFSIGMVMFIGSYLWSTYHLLKDYRETMYIFLLVLYTISIVVLLMSMDKRAHFLASVISFPAVLLTAISKGSFTESISLISARFDGSWIRVGHLLGNFTAAIYVYFQNPSSFYIFVIWGCFCALHLVHLHTVEWSTEKMISNVLGICTLFLFNVYVTDLISFGSVQETTFHGFQILSLVSTSFRCILKIQDPLDVDTAAKGFFLFLFAVAWVIAELIFKSYVSPVQQLDFWTFLCANLTITSLLTFVLYWDYLCYTYVYFLGLVFFYAINIGFVWLSFQGDPFQSSKILWFTPLLLVVFPLVYRFVRYE